MDDFDDFDNELDDLLKNAIEDDKNKASPQQSQQTQPSSGKNSAPLSTPFPKSKPTISLFDDDDPISKRESGTGPRAATSSGAGGSGNSFLDALFGSGASSRLGGGNSAASHAGAPTGQNRSLEPTEPKREIVNPSVAAHPVETEGTDPLDAILSRTRARKAALNLQVNPAPARGIATHESTTTATSSSRRKITSPPISSDSDESDGSSEEDKAPPPVPIPSARKDKQTIAKSAITSPPEERSSTPAVAKTVRKGPLLDVDSLAGIDIRKAALSAPPKAASTDIETSRNRKYSIEKESASAEVVLNRLPESSTGAQSINTEVDDLVKHYESEIEKLKGELNETKSLLEKRDSELSQAQELKTSEWQDKIEARLQRVGEAQDQFLASVRKELSQIREQDYQDKEERRLQEEERLAKDEQDRIREIQRREEFEDELKARYEAMVDRTNRVNGLVVQKMRTEHERELMLVERTKQQEVDQVMKAFDQGRTVRDISNRMQSIVATMESLQHSLMSDFCEKLERRLQLMEKRLAGAPARVDDLVQHFRTIAENVLEANDETRAELGRLRKELRTFTDEQDDFRHMLLREHRSLVAQVVADRTNTQLAQQAYAGNQEQFKSFLTSWEGELDRREKQVQATSLELDLVKTSTQH